MDILLSLGALILGAGVIGLIIKFGLAKLKGLADKTENKLDDSLADLAIRHEDELIKFLEDQAKKFLEERKKKEDEKK